MAAEIVALVAHSVVGHDWLSSTHCSDATNSVDSISADDDGDFGQHPGRATTEALQVGHRTYGAPRDQHGEQQPTRPRVGPDRR